MTTNPDGLVSKDYTLCPDAQYHGNPYRYCPYIGCGWTENMESPAVAPDPLPPWPPLAIKSWVDGGAVATDALRRELREWADVMALSAVEWQQRYSTARGDDV